ncbi:hypothetical protein B7C62_17105 [Kitasatospora albolonga]|uniref:Uncharacterized protein n=1 Tax=Kitasatospora albolonga TaxID=68173 RepID=A0ABC8BU67_9ACTN|nr:hypothetical protein B7C62_17105 [Kitasatospora albolonga]
MSADVFTIEPQWIVQAPYLRCTLKRALALQSAHNVWSGTEHIENAVSMAYGDQLPDFGRWELTRSQLRTLKIAIEWRRATRAASDQKTAPDILERWTQIEDEVIAAYCAVSNEAGLHSI